MAAAEEQLRRSLDRLKRVVQDEIASSGRRFQGEPSLMDRFWDSRLGIVMDRAAQRAMRLINLRI
jgi:hypothetical protein